MPGTECKIVSRQKLKFNNSNQEYILVKATEIGGSEIVEAETQSNTEQPTQQGTGGGLTLENLKLHQGSISVSNSQKFMDDLESDVGSDVGYDYDNEPYQKPINHKGSFSHSNSSDLGDYEY